MSSAPPPTAPRADILVRAARTEDVPGMLQVSNSSQEWLIAQGLASAKEQPPITPDRMGWFTKKAEQDADWDTNTGRIFVAEIGNLVVGWCMATLAWPPHLPDTDLSQLYLSAIYVHQEYMKQGVARALIGFLKTEAGMQHVELIRAECKRIDKLVQYHEAWGFTPVEYTGFAPDYEEKMQLFHMDLRPEDERD
ncbi:acyl-CoA N-acyltransferase [Calocera viscosa TUFC12733]|uniref:Acyl-CoA N-acyltransferase n=1 Tax=Calocera viscosa (strain TUFC12733) TaxID=1330018 RepID=A0A167HN60_CALVF|nr:acyl-CoA N-acyltransferase [Calocera viscosa TUFC12733]